MIEESLLKSCILGKDGFVWWIGRVAHSKYCKNENDAALAESAKAIRESMDIKPNNIVTVEVTDNGPGIE